MSEQTDLDQLAEVLRQRAVLDPDAPKCIIVPSGYRPSRPKTAPLSPEDESTMKALREVLDTALEDAVAALPSVEDAKQWKRENSGYYISPELENQVAKYMSDYAMEVLLRSGYFDGRDSKGESGEPNL